MFAPSAAVAGARARSSALCVLPARPEKASTCATGRTAAVTASSPGTATARADARFLTHSGILFPARSALSLVWLRREARTDFAPRRTAARYTLPAPSNFGGEFGGFRHVILLDVVRRGCLCARVLELTQ